VRGEEISAPPPRRLGRREYQRCEEV